MSAFDNTFREVCFFTEGMCVLSGRIPKDEAAKIFSTELNLAINVDEIKEDRVRYGFATDHVLDIEPGESCWYTGASGKGSMPVWIYDNRGNKQ